MIPSTLVHKLPKFSDFEPKKFISKDFSLTRMSYELRKSLREFYPDIFNEEYNIDDDKYTSLAAEGLICFMRLIFSSIPQNCMLNFGMEVINDKFVFIFTHNKGIFNRTIAKKLDRYSKRGGFEYSMEENLVSLYFPAFIYESQEVRAKIEEESILPFYNEMFFSSVSLTRFRSTGGMES